MRSPRAWAMCQQVGRNVDREVGSPIAPRRASGVQSDSIALGTDSHGIAVTVHDVTVDASGATVPVYAYRPPPAEPVPAHLLLHGGAFWSGNTGQLDFLAREYARAAGCAVLSVEYRLAPEHRFPTAAEDAYAVLGWAVEQAARLGVDPRRLSVGGLSCGGAIAAAVTLMTRDRSGPRLAFQVLETPVLDLTLSMPSVHRYGRGGVLTVQALREGYEFYAPDAADRRHPYASPLLAPDLTGLPPAFVLTAQYDPLREEGERYAARLRSAGVPARVVRARNHAHSTLHAGGGPPFASAATYRALTASALRAAVRPDQDLVL